MKKCINCYAGNQGRARQGHDGSIAPAFS